MNLSSLQDARSIYVHQFYFCTPAMNNLKFKNNFIHNSVINNKIVINLIEKVLDLYTGNCKTLLREINEEPNKWRDTLHSWIRRLNVMGEDLLILPKWQCSPNLSTESMQFLSKFWLPYLQKFTW